MNGCSQMALQSTTLLFKVSSFWLWCAQCVARCIVVQGAVNLISFLISYVVGIVLSSRACVRAIVPVVVLFALFGCSPADDPPDIDEAPLTLHQESAPQPKQIASIEDVSVNTPLLIPVPSAEGGSESVSRAGLHTGVPEQQGEKAVLSTSVINDLSTPSLGGGELGVLDEPGPRNDLELADADPVDAPSPQLQIQDLEKTDATPKGDSPEGGVVQASEVISSDDTDEAAGSNTVMEGEDVGLSALDQLEAVKALPLQPYRQLNQAREPLTFRILDLHTQVKDESFTPHFKAQGRMQVVQPDGNTFGSNDVIHLWLSYRLEVASVSLVRKGTLTLTLRVLESGGVPEGAFEVSLPLPRHDLSAESAELSFDVLGWQPLQRGRLEMQRPPATMPDLN